MTQILNDKIEEILQERKKQEDNKRRALEEARQQLKTEIREMEQRIFFPNDAWQNIQSKLNAEEERLKEEDKRSASRYNSHAAEGLYLTWWDRERKEKELIEQQKKEINQVYFTPEFESSLQDALASYQQQLNQDSGLASMFREDLRTLQLKKHEYELRLKHQERINLASKLPTQAPRAETTGFTVTTISPAELNSSEPQALQEHESGGLAAKFKHALPLVGAATATGVGVGLAGSFLLFGHPLGVPIALGGLGGLAVGVGVAQQRASRSPAPTEEVRGAG